MTEDVVNNIEQEEDKKVKKKDNTVCVGLDVRQQRTHYTSC